MDFNHSGHVPIHHPHHFQRPLSPNGQPFANQYQHMEQQHIEPAASRNLQPAPPPHILSHDANGHLHQQYYQDQNHDRHSLATPQTPSQHQSPRFSTLTPAPPRSTFQQSYIPQDRSLPDRNVTEDNIADAYVAFILYCNPCFPLSVDTTLLKLKFTELPASEGVRHSIYRLYELIKRHEAKDPACEHWTKMILLLGVNGPDTEKKQSAQKLSQYGVRLKVSPRQFFLLHKPDCTTVLASQPRAELQLSILSTCDGEDNVVLVQAQDLRQFKFPCIKGEWSTGSLQISSKPYRYR